MVQGRLRKYYEEVVLLEQVFVIDNETKISKVVEAAAKEAGSAITLKAFARFELGEGIEKEETDFAAEVAQAVQGLAESGQTVPVSRPVAAAHRPGSGWKGI